MSLFKEFGIILNIIFLIISFLKVTSFLDLIWFIKNTNSIAKYLTLYSKIFKIISSKSSNYKMGQICKFNHNYIGLTQKLVVKILIIFKSCPCSRNLGSY